MRGRRGGAPQLLSASPRERTRAGWPATMPCFSRTARTRAFSAGFSPRTKPMYFPCRRRSARTFGDIFRRRTGRAAADAARRRPGRPDDTPPVMPSSEASRSRKSANLAVPIAQRLVDLRLLERALCQKCRAAHSGPGPVSISSLCPLYCASLAPLLWARPSEDPCMAGLASLQQRRVSAFVRHRPRAAVSPRPSSSRALRESGPSGNQGLDDVRPDQSFLPS